MHIDELYRAHIALSYIYRVIVLSVHHGATSATNRSNKRRMLDEMPPLHGLTCENGAVETKRFRVCHQVLVFLEKSKSFVKEAASGLPLTEVAEVWPRVL
ncbi:MAG: hypothetical protein Q9185_006973 [Variospora sp. 1 TL-2023]